MSFTADRIGPYELVGELGRGAMARVWRAWDPALGREVAIKEPLFAPGLSPAVIDEMGRRFVTEGRAAAQLTHPGIVGVYASGVFDGRPAIVMELVEGVTLSALLERGPLAPSEALALLDQLLDAVGYAHARGIVHRDIKPDNIFVTPEGRVKLADFGIAHIEGLAMTRLTVAGAVLGTPGYMSPEQAVGKPVDRRSDLFSIGVVAYEMLTGANPFGAGAPDATTLIYRIVHEPAPELSVQRPDVPTPMADGIMAVLAKDPDERPATAVEFKTLLHGGGKPEDTMAAADIWSQATQATPAATGRGAPSVWEDTVERLNLGVSDSGATETNARESQRKGLPGWLPYALVAGICSLALALVFISATAGGERPGVASGAGGSQEKWVPTAADEGNDAPPEEEAGQAETTTYTTGFSEQDPPYRLTVDTDGMLGLYDAHDRRMDNPRSYYGDVSILPTWAVARLEQDITYDSFDEAYHEFTTTDADCVPYDDLKWKTDANAVQSDSDVPFWCVVIGVYESEEDAFVAMVETSGEFGFETSYIHTTDWRGLHEAYRKDANTPLYDKDCEGYCVVMGISSNHYEVLEQYLSLSEVLGQAVDQQALDAIMNGEESWRYIDEFEEIKYSGTRQYIERR